MSRKYPAVKDHQHGTRTGYTYGCRCDACTAAAAADNLARRASMEEAALRAHGLIDAPFRCALCHSIHGAGECSVRIESVTVFGDYRASS